MVDETTVASPPFPAATDAAHATERFQQLNRGVKAVREDKSKRTNNSKHYLLADGSYRAFISLSNVHYQDEEGQWEEIDTALVDEADLDAAEGKKLSKELAQEAKAIFNTNKQLKKAGKLDRSQTDFRALQVPFDAKLPKDFRKGYSMTAGKDKLSFTPMGANKSIGVVDSVYANTVMYRQAWKQTDVELAVTPDGIKEYIHLLDESAPTSFSFELNTKLSKDRTLGELHIPSLWLRDSRGEIRPITPQLMDKGNKTIFQFTADVQGLSYPIVIDPGIHKKTGGDAYVTSANPTLNTGGYGTLEVGITPEAGTRYSYLQFDFSSLVGNSNINYALLYLNQIGYSSTPPYAYTKVAIRRVTSPWSESTITWNNQPNYTDTHTSSSNTLNATGYDFYPPWEVSQIIKDSIAYNQPYGFIVQGFENYSGGMVTFTSRDSSPELAPYIYVDYTPTAPMLTSPNGGEVLNGSHTISWLPYSDSSTPVASVSYHIQLSTDGRVTWKDIVAQTAAGVTSYTYNFANEAESVNAWIRVRGKKGAVYTNFDKSDEPFRIYHNVIPNAPTGLAPGGATAASTLVTGLTPTLQWTFSDPDAGDKQSAFRVDMLNSSGTSVYNSGWVSSMVSSFTVPSGILAYGGTYAWKVSVKDTRGDSSPYSALSYIRTDSSELNDTAASAYAIEGSRRYDSYLTSPTDVDVYVFTAPMTGTYHLSMKSPVGNNFDVAMLNSSQATVLQSTAPVGVMEQLSLPMQAGQTYYLKIYGAGGSYDTSNSYALRINLSGVAYEYDTRGRLKAQQMEVGLLRYRYELVYDNKGNHIKTTVTTTEITQ